MKPVKRKDGRYMISVDIGKDEDGKRIRKSVYDIDPREVKIKAHKLQTQVYNNTFAEPSKMTVESIIDLWKDIHKSNIQKTTLEAYEYNIKHIKKHLGKIKLKDLKPYDIQKFYSDLKLSNNTIRKIHVILNKSLNVAVKNNLLNANPCNFVDVPKKTKYEINIIDDDKFKSLLNTNKDTPFYISVVLAGYMGLRKGEVLALRWADIDFKSNKLTVAQSLARVKGGVIFKEPKNDGSKRTILMPDRVIEIIKNYKKVQFQNRSKDWQDYGLIVCQANGKPYRPDNFAERFKELYNMRFHDLRHFNATLMLKLGISDKMAADRLGHKQVATLHEIYQHVIKDIEQDAVDKLNSII